MDRSVPLPGGYRIGLDGILGLIPGVGDAITGVFSGYILLAARQEGAPPSVIARMLLNVLIDAVVGAIPVVGDLFDFYFKSNLRNIKLLDDYKLQPRNTVRKSRTSVVLFTLLFAAFLVLVGASIVLAVRGVLALMSG